MPNKNPKSQLWELNTMEKTKIPNIAAESLQRLKNRNQACSIPKPTMAAAREANDGKKLNLSCASSVRRKHYSLPNVITQSAKFKLNLSESESKFYTACSIAKPTVTGLPITCPNPKSRRPETAQ